MKSFTKCVLFAAGDVVYLAILSYLGCDMKEITPYLDEGWFGASTTANNGKQYSLDCWSNILIGSQQTVRLISNIIRLISCKI